MGPGAGPGVPMARFTVESRGVSPLGPRSHVLPAPNLSPEEEQIPDPNLKHNHRNFQSVHF